MACVKLLENLPQVKVILESEIVEDSLYANNYLKVGYSDYVINRAATMSKIYKFNRPLAIVLNQNHQTAVSKIIHDTSVRIIDNVVPSRLIDSPTYVTDYTYIANELTLQELNDIFGLTVS